MSGYSDEGSLTFAAAADDLRKALPKVSPSEIVEALGLDSDGLNSTLAVISAGIIMDAHKGAELGSQNQLFRLGITLGRAYERKLATESANGDIDL